MVLLFWQLPFAPRSKPKHPDEPCRRLLRRWRAFSFALPLEPSLAWTLVCGLVRRARQHVTTAILPCCWRRCVQRERHNVFVKRSVAERQKQMVHRTRKRRSTNRRLYHVMLAITCQMQPALAQILGENLLRCPLGHLKLRRPIQHQICPA